jgi:hypothetical protein
MENFGSLANFNIQASDSIHASDSSTDREGNSKRKSVSFASEVSFQSISPAISPKRQANAADSKSAETSAEKTGEADGEAGGQEVITEGAGDDRKKEDAKEEVVDTGIKQIEMIFFRAKLFIDSSFSTVMALLIFCYRTFHSVYITFLSCIE